MPRWSIKEDEREDDAAEDHQVALIVTAPNGMRFESFHSHSDVSRVVEDLQTRNVFAVGDDPVMPSDWPSLVLVPVRRPCRRCGDDKSDTEFSLKPNGQISGTCDECCLHDRRRNGKPRPCDQCGNEHPDIRMRRGVVGCPECLRDLSEEASAVTRPFDVDEFCRQQRDGAGLPIGNARASARNDIPRSIVPDSGKLP